MFLGNRAATSELTAIADGSSAVVVLGDFSSVGQPLSTVIGGTSDEVFWLADDGFGTYYLLRSAYDSSAAVTMVSGAPNYPVKYVVTAAGGVVVASAEPDYGTSEVVLNVTSVLPSTTATPWGALPALAPYVAPFFYPSTMSVDTTAFACTDGTVVVAVLQQSYDYPFLRGHVTLLTHDPAAGTLIKSYEGEVSFLGDDINNQLAILGAQNNLPPGVFYLRVDYGDVYRLSFSSPTSVAATEVISRTDHGNYAYAFVTDGARFLARHAKYNGSTGEIDRRGFLYDIDGSFESTVTVPTDGVGFPYGAATGGAAPAMTCFWTDLVGVQQECPEPAP